MRATNWVGDAVMSLPALRAMRERFPDAHIAVLARPVGGGPVRARAGRRPRDPLHRRALREDWPASGARPRLRARNSTAPSCCRTPSRRRWWRGWRAFRARIGYAATAAAGCSPTRVPRARARRDSAPRALLLPGTAAARRHHRTSTRIRARSGWTASRRRARRAATAARSGHRGPGDRGEPRRGLRERQALAAGAFRRSGRRGGGGDRRAGGAVRLGRRARAVRTGGAPQVAGRAVRNFAGRPRLAEFIELAAACRLFLTNDSGAMHIASALGVPTVAVFGATDDTTTGPTGPLARVVREPVECSPCLLRECPIDHRCMTRVAAGRVAHEALELLKYGTVDTRSEDHRARRGRAHRRRRRRAAHRGYRLLRRPAGRARRAPGGASRAAAEALLVVVPDPRAAAASGARARRVGGRAARGRLRGGRRNRLKRCLDRAVAIRAIGWRGNRRRAANAAI